MGDGLEKDFDTFLTEHGVTLSELLNVLDEKNAACLQMSEKNHKLFCELYDEISKPSSTTKDKGNKLELLTEVLFSKAFPNIFQVVRDCRTSTNEIDLMIDWTRQANIIGLNKEFDGLGCTFLCECKNYDGKVSVTYVGKFSSLLSCSDTKMGILIAWHGVTGSGWSAGSGLIKKIALAEKRYILVITQEDLYRIYKGETNIFSLLKTKYRSLKQDISYEKIITAHALSEKWSADTKKDG